MSCYMPYAEHTDNNKDTPIAEGDRSTKSYQTIVTEAQCGQNSTELSGSYVEAIPSYCIFGRL